MERASRVRWRICVFLLLAVSLSFLDRINFSVAAKSLQEQFGIGDNRLGLIFSAFGVGYALFQIPGGALGDLFGARRVLTFSIVSCSALTAGAAFVDRAWMFAGIRFLIGVGIAPVLANCNRVVATWLPAAERARGNGMFMMGVGVGGALTPPFVAWLVSVNGWRWMFLICAAIGLLFAAGWRLYFTETPEQHRGVNEAELRLIRQGRSAQPLTGPMSGPMSGNAPWRRIFSSLNIWLLVISYLLQGYTTYVFYTWFYLYLVNVRHLPAVQAGLWSAAPFAAFGALSLLGGAASDAAARRLGRKSGRRVCVWLGAFGSTAVILIGSRLENPYWAILLLSLGAGLNGFATPSWWAATIDVGRDYSGSLAGFMNMAGNIGGAISPALTPWLAGRFGWITAIDVAAATIGLSGALWVFVNAELEVG